MREGWQGENYLILFDDSEISEFTRLYGIASSIPGYEVVGLIGWDDFVVRDSKGRFFTVPTVPIDPQYLAPATVAIDGAVLVADEKLAGMVKWYKQPLVFRGSLTAPDNVCWISLNQHCELVEFWNKTYRRIAQH